ncbi:hypothetical protein C1H76_1993 [Elsinoe australis]|uniref:Uncharacterized protein n=1 Tax=Elsinoe australis TaxID=40998 RepID=A0A4U7BD11_9PEZI|nr:hypothetical protein C1H76_1993 [Elsinoe australis]
MKFSSKVTSPPQAKEPTSPPAPTTPTSRIMKIPRTIRSMVSLRSVKSSASPANKNLPGTPSSPEWIPLGEMEKEKTTLGKDKPLPAVPGEPSSTRNSLDMFNYQKILETGAGRDDRAGETSLAAAEVERADSGDYQTPPSYLKGTPRLSPFPLSFSRPRPVPGIQPRGEAWWKAGGSGHGKGVNKPSASLAVSPCVSPSEEGGMELGGEPGGEAGGEAKEKAKEEGEEAQDGEAGGKGKNVVWELVGGGAGDVVGLRAWVAGAKEAVEREGDEGRKVRMGRAVKMVEWAAVEWEGFGEGEE